MPRLQCLGSVRGQTAFWVSNLVSLADEGLDCVSNLCQKSSTKHMLHFNVLIDEESLDSHTDFTSLWLRETQSISDKPVYVFYVHATFLVDLCWPLTLAILWAGENMLQSHFFLGTFSISALVSKVVEAKGLRFGNALGACQLQWRR